MRKGLTVVPVVGLPEVAEGADLAELIGENAELYDGDVVSVTSKIVSKAEGRVLTGVTRAEAVDAELVRVVAQRENTRIVQTRHGLVLAAAGTDTSNTAPGTVLLLPVDPDASARRLREALRERYDVNVGVIVTDTLGRPWRNGQTDLAIGAAGVEVLEDLRGTTDSHGNTLAVTVPAVADELAAASELVKGKADGVPVAVLRGADDVVLPAGEHGPGAAALVRDAESDLFSLGTREAAWAAVTERRAPAGPRDLDPELAGRLVAAAAGAAAVEVSVDPAALVVRGPDEIGVGAVAERLAVLLHAEGYGVAVARSSGGTAEVSFGSR
jgi:coenzyme F420-0:L-glutamate ligase/coenzyme F420-1:gamma-L-glutamate ligase